jgi:hypothetical protein
VLPAPLGNVDVAEAEFHHPLVLLRIQETFGSFEALVVPTEK